MAHDVRSLLPSPFSLLPSPKGTSMVATAPQVTDITSNKPRKRQKKTAFDRSLLKDALIAAFKKLDRRGCHDWRARPDNCRAQRRANLVHRLARRVALVHRALRQCRRGAGRGSR